MGSPYRWGQGWMGAGSASDDDFASAGQRTVAEELWRSSGHSPTDVDVALVYDHFTPMVILGLEDFGFCKKGEGGPFVEGGRIPKTVKVALQSVFTQGNPLTFPRGDRAAWVGDLGVKTLGDGIICVFEDPDDAFRAASETQTTVHAAAQGTKNRLQLKVGFTSVSLR